MKSSKRAWQSCSFPSIADTYKNEVLKVFKTEGKKYAVPGFRKGKAPRHLIERMYGPDVFTYDGHQQPLPQRV